MTGFLHELRRRRVPKVAAIYLAAAWVTFEVADATFPRLGLPDWAVTLILVLAILGLPVALVLAWFYDLTGSGVQRTAPAPGGQSPRGVAVIGAVVVLALAGASWVTFADRGVALEEGTVAVLPFRAGGDMAHLQEGMVDLLSTKLSGDFGPRAVDQRVTLRAWRAAGGGQDLVPGEAAEVAREVGASHVLTGEVVPTGRSVTISATLMPATSGLPRRIRTTVTGSADSVLQLVDRLTAELLGQEAGLDRDRLASLTSSSVDAVMAYLEGQRAERAGQFEEAAGHYGRAIALDTTFALAAFGQAAALGWVDQGETFRRARRLAWDHRDRLSRRDRALLAAVVGPHGPDGTATIHEWLAAVEEAIRLAPDNASAREALGDDYFHEGYRIADARPARQALELLLQATELDPDFTSPHLHIIELAAHLGDTAMVREYYNRYVGHSGLETSGAVPPGYLAALALGDSALRARFEPRLEALQETQLGYIIGSAGWIGLPLDGYRRVRRRQLDRATGQDRVRPLTQLAMIEIADGRIRSLGPVLEELRDVPGQWFWGYLAGAVLDGDSALARAWLEEESADTAVPEDRRAFYRCLIDLYRAERGDTAGLAAAAAAAEGTHPDHAACGLALEATAAVLTRPEDAGPALARLDSFASVAPGVGLRDVRILDVARLWGAAGRPEEALAVARRLSIDTRVYPAAWLIHARAAAELGLVDEATRMYRLYLARRASAEPGTRAFANLEAARREMAALRDDAG